MTLTICQLQNKSLEEKKEEKTLSPSIHNQPLDVISWSQIKLDVQQLNMGVIFRCPHILCHVAFTECGFDLQICSFDFIFSSGSEKNSRSFEAE